MNTKVSYGALAPVMIGGLGVVVNALLMKGKRAEPPVSLKRLSDVIEFSDSGVWGDNSLDPEIEPRVFRVSDFDGDFRLDYGSAPPRAIDLNKLAKFQLRRGDILVVKSSGSANQVVSGRVAVFNSDSEQAYAASNFTLRLRPKADIDPHYLAFVLGSPPVREAVADSVKTMTYPNLSFRIYSAIEVPVIPLVDQKLVGAFFDALLNKRELPTLPTYLAEQQRVVVRIEELAAQIYEARTLRCQAAEEAEALIRSAITRMDQEQRTRLPLITLQKFASMEKGALRSGPFGSALLHSEFTAEGVPAIGIQDVQENRFELTRRWNVSPTKAEELRRYTVKPQDILITVMGTLGRACVVPEDVPRMVSTKHVWTVTLDQKRCDPWWVSYWLNFSRFVREELLGQGTGTAIPGLNGEKIRALSLPDTPLPEQRRIVAELDALKGEVDALKRLQAETAAELAALLPSILDKAFKGEL